MPIPKGTELISIVGHFIVTELCDY